MAYATNEERLALVNSSDFDVPFVVRFSKNGRESEITADDFEHAYELAMSWKHAHGADYVEMFRVDQTDGSLYGGIGAL